MADYRAKFVLAPMVRIGELPTRLLALKYGADLVWGPEIIDKKILLCDRVYNEELDTVDFLNRKGNLKVPGVTNVVFRTYRKAEKNKLIFQMGTANPELAVQAAKIIAKDVDGIDINAGCPKHFSIHAGMGAALLKTPDLLCNILTSLVEQVGKPYSKPISVKIRLLDEKEDTLTLVKRLVATGISNLTLHCRTRDMRNREDPIRDYLDEIIQICKDSGVTFIVNGGIQGYADFKEIQSTFGDDIGCMIASAAEKNISCFNKEGPLNWKEVARTFVETAQKFKNNPPNTKYTLLRLIPGNAEVYQTITRMKDIADMQQALENIKNEVEKEQDDRKRRASVSAVDAAPKKVKT